MAKRATPWNPHTADWLVNQRGKRTQDAVIEDMAARGVKVKRAWLSRMENGAPFSDYLLAAFKDYYGSEPPAYAETVDAPVTSDALLTALLRQAEAIDALVAEIRNAALSVTGSQAAMPDLIRTELERQRLETESWVRSVAADEVASKLSLDPTRDRAGTPAK